MTIQDALKSQYHAGLAMLRETIDKCPASLWTDPAFTNPTWQVAYHTLFYTHLYLQPAEKPFVPWPLHRPGYHRLGEPLPDGGALQPYTTATMVACWQWCDTQVNGAVDRLDLEASESGFPWYPIPKLAHQFVNLRHLQHHTGQLAERLRTHAGLGLAWVG
jgi:hypothetical protein